MTAANLGGPELSACLRVVVLLTAGVTLSGLASRAWCQTQTWADVDCSKSDIVMSRYTKCQIQTAVAGSEGRGEFQSQTATYRSADELVYVFLQKPRITFANASIKVTPEARESFLSRPSKDVPQSASNLSATTHLVGGYVKTYSLSPDWKCFSFVKDAPYRGDGVAYFMVGYSCTKTATAQTEPAMTSFLQKLGVK